MCSIQRKYIYCNIKPFVVEFLTASPVINCSMILVIFSIFVLFIIINYFGNNPDSEHIFSETFVVVFINSFYAYVQKYYCTCKQSTLVATRIQGTSLSPHQAHFVVLSAFWLLIQWFRFTYQMIALCTNP